MVGVSDPMERLAILYGRCADALIRVDARRTNEYALMMISEASHEPTGQGALVARRVLGVSQMYAGDLAGADANLQWAIDHYDLERDRGLAIRFSHDQSVAARYYLAFTKWLLGDAREAAILIAEAKSHAEFVGHAPSIAAAHGLAAWLDWTRRDFRGARANAERALALSREFDLPTWRQIATLWMAWAKAETEGTPALWDDMHAALEAHRGNGVMEALQPYYDAAAYAEMGEFERAVIHADEAIARLEQRGVGMLLPEAHRLRGEMLLRRDPGDPAPAEAALQTAIAIAREQQSRSFGLRAALSLAKLYQSTGRPVEAHGVLAPALEGFSAYPGDARDRRSAGAAAGALMRKPSIGQEQVLDVEFETRRFEAQATGRENPRLDHVAMAALVPDGGAAFGIEDEIMRHARQREIAGELHSVVARLRAFRQDFDHDDRVRNLDRAGKQALSAIDQRIGLKRHARRNADGHAVGHSPAGRVHAFDCMPQRRPSLRLRLRMRHPLWRYGDRPAVKELPAAFAPLDPAEKLVHAHQLLRHSRHGDDNTTARFTGKPVPLCL